MPAAARCCAPRRRCSAPDAGDRRGAGRRPRWTAWPPSAELALIRRLAAWPRTVEAAAQAREPHRIAFFLYDLAADFHMLWNRGKDDSTLRFLQADRPAETLARLALVAATAVVIRSGLAVMGVDARRGNALNVSEHASVRTPTYRVARSRGMDPATRRLALTAAVLGGAFLAVVGAWSLVGHRHHGTDLRIGTSEVPVIEPPPGPMRLRPTNPGGMQLSVPSRTCSAARVMAGRRSWPRHRKRPIPPRWNRPRLSRPGAGPNCITRACSGDSHCNHIRAGDPARTFAANRARRRGRAPARDEPDRPCRSAACCPSNGTGGEGSVGTVATETTRSEGTLTVDHIRRRERQDLVSPAHRRLRRSCCGENPLRSGTRKRTKLRRAARVGSLQRHREPPRSGGVAPSLLL